MTPQEIALRYKEALDKGVTDADLNAAIVLELVPELMNRVAAYQSFVEEVKKMGESGFDPAVYSNAYGAFREWRFMRDLALARLEDKLNPTGLPFSREAIEEEKQGLARVSRSMLDAKVGGGEV